VVDPFCSVSSHRSLSLNFKSNALLYILVLSIPHIYANQCKNLLRSLLINHEFQIL
jgi:hypothetical protein